MLYLLSNCASPRSAPRMLSKKRKIYFLFSLQNVLLINSCNSLANSCFGISTTAPLPLHCLSKNYKPLKQELYSIHHILDYSLFQMFYHETLYQRLSFQWYLYDFHKSYLVGNMIYWKHFYENLLNHEFLKIFVFFIFSK